MTSSQMYLAFSGGMCENAGAQTTCSFPQNNAVKRNSRGNSCGATASSCLCKPRLFRC